jgi:hypothetical protein
VYTGAPGFTAGKAICISLKVNLSGQPVMAFSDEVNSYKLSVMKFDGANWVYVGSPGSSSGFIEYASLAFGPDSKPYVAFEDYGEEGKAAMMRFDGAEWNYVGEDGFTSDEADFISLAFGPDGKPYVAFEDYGYSGKATVMKYDSVYTGMNNAVKVKISLFPNPADKFITVGFNNYDSGYKYLEIYDLNGKKIFGTELSSEKITLDIENYPPGIYFIKLRTSKSSIILKLCKM